MTAPFSLLLVLILICLAPVGHADPAQNAPLTLEAVLRSVKDRYPPFLAALIEQDIMNGRAQQALGAFDTSISSAGATRPSGYYDGSSGFAVVEKPLSSWGGSVYSGYRFSSGFVADYDKNRTQEDGEAMVGFRLPILRDGTLDKRRATLFKARIDQELADPFILRQHLDFIRAASMAYFNWMAAGYHLRLTEQLLEIANTRQTAIAEMVSKGAQAPIVQTDNERLVISRQLNVVSARRRLEAHAIELSLFYRDTMDQPVRPSRNQLAGAFPAVKGPQNDQMANDIAKALIFRPEIRRIDLALAKNGIDQRLAKNNLLPRLDLNLEANQALGGRVESDIEPFEVEVRLNFNLPLERREAKGRLAAAESSALQLLREMQFARDQITAAVRDAYSALQAAHDQIQQTARNVELAIELEAAENARFQQGAADLLALQIREQSTFDARLLQVQATADYFRAQAHYRAAIAADAPTSLARATPAP